MNITEKYLWMPIKTAAKAQKISVFEGGKKIREFDLQLDEHVTDYYVYLDVSAWIGKDLTFAGMSEQYIKRIKQHPTKPPCENDKRPRIHFTTDIGWINDPNGLVYHDGVYHLFYQHNPFGVEWGNMTWGHATSTDLFHWHRKETALYPDETGTMFSGCGFVDEKNVFGQGKDALLFYYTAAGNYNEWSKDQTFTQRLAISTDGGEMLEKQPETILDHVVGENRDPKVFWHAASNAYIMVLYLDQNEFSILRSTDLKRWEESQRLSLDKLWECPDLIELPIDGDQQNTAWIFLSADGYYHVGKFDGHQFTATEERQQAYQTTLPYAAQSYAGTDRKILVAWMRTPNRGSCHTGSMSIPMELGLTQNGSKLQLTTKPVDEIETLRTHSFHMGNVERTPQVNLNGDAAEMEVSFTANATGKATFFLSGQEMIIDFDNKVVLFEHESISFDEPLGIDLRIILDYEVFEVYLGNHCYIAMENKTNTLEEVSMVSDATAPSFDIHFYAFATADFTEEDND